MLLARVCLVVLLILPVAALSQVPPRDNPIPTVGSAIIRGRVVDAATGRPLSRVEVYANSSAGSPAAGLTDGDGRYEFKELPTGTYTITATKANYVRSSWGEQRAEGPGSRLTLTGGQKIDDINFTLKRTGVVTGRIVDEFGDPVTDVFVTAMRYQYVQGSRRLAPSGRWAETNDIGEYRLYGLSPGQYYVSATLRSVGGPMADTNDRSAYAATFYPGTGNVAEAQRLTVSPSQTVTAVNLTLLPIQAARVSGTATDAEGKPLAGASIAVGQRLGIISMGGTMSPVRPDGKFTINGLSPGDYTLRVNGRAGETATADVTVNGSDLTDVQLVAVMPSTLRGRVVFRASATSAPAPRPTAIDLGAVRDWAIGQPARSQARIKEDGSFEITLPPGHVLIRGVVTGPAPFAAAGATPPPWRLTRVIVNDVDVGDTGIDVPPNATIENVIVEMTNHGGDASGRVMDADGATVRDCFVIVFAQDPAHWTAQSRYVGVVRPGLDELFHVRLLPGDYYVAAMSDVEIGAWTDPEFLGLARDRATKFSIADGDKRVIDLLLVPAPVF